ncbi:hypothetical protein PDESU_04205 [Pontiella desulfatans]|uniref:Ice-binding protein C-terminal domain-containing protein n=1 Tax=Pontiella desulfatans TaxID=2750659 RepID=A0A6C2U6H4_PONDE|nr:PEP-CTERM sorting domain-containing protein [Pontiella desulfatans]VGO15620.1 hypothetical protein PDESU_04205 [Pontiella desulfatans]
MKTMKITGIAVATALVALSASYADVTLSTSAPTSDILSSAGGGINTSLFDEDANDNHARGQLFSLADGTGTGYKITAITIRKDVNQTYANDILTLRIFEGTAAQWGTGTGHSTSIDGSNYFVDTTVSPLYTEAFTLNGTFADNNYVTFQLATALEVSEDSDFGFLMTYDRSSTSNPDRFQHYEGSAGGRVAITSTAHTTPSTRNIHYYVQGTVIPEPATLGLFALFGGAVMFIRRRFSI